MPASLLLLLSFWLPAVAGFVQARQSGSHDLLSWNEFYPLQWYDFQGEPDESSQADAAASIQIKAKPFLVKNKVHYNVVAVFNRKKSWAREKSASLLAHEQLHFNIAELYARKIRKKVKALQDAGTDDVKEFNAAIEALLVESNKADIEYDLETLHGALLRKQRKWEADVKAGLRALEGYKKPKRIIAK